jgi:peptidoglycan-associated lipoprotein
MKVGSTDAVPVTGRSVDMKRFGFLFLVMMFGALMLMPACGGEDAPPPETDIEPVEETPPPPPPPVEEETPEEIEKSMAEIIEELQGQIMDVFFDYDKYAIKGEFKAKLEANAELLMANEELNLVIEGHCDERGTAEYNLALGEKRAKAVMDFYIAYGVDADRLSMISFGEERPFAYGSDEQAWAQNRRAHMVLKE